MAPLPPSPSWTSLSRPSLPTPALPPSLTDIFKIEEADGKTIAYVKLHDKDLARDFTWQVQLEKDVNGLWTATRILNFTDYLKERMDG